MVPTPCIWPAIRTADRLAYQLWQEVQANPDYRDKTTLLIMPEFGRDPDGSSTNGFFNHRANDDSTRDTWMMALGAGVDRRGVVERPIRHIDICPTLASLLGCRSLDLQGASPPRISRMRTQEMCSVPSPNRTILCPLLSFKNRLDGCTIQPPEQTEATATVDVQADS